MLVDGKKFAREREEGLREVVGRMKRKPRMVSFLVGDDEASKLYTKLKQQAAERVGIEFRVSALNPAVGGKGPFGSCGFWGSVEELKELIRKESEKYDGVMVQLPLPMEMRDKTDEVLTAIPLEKDVDGLRWEESGVVPATVKAVLSILEAIEREGEQGLWRRRFVVVGARGRVGKPLVYFLRKRGVVVDEVEIDTREPEAVIKRAEVLISCVGKPKLIKADQVREGVIVVDVGISKIQNKSGVVGDMEKGVYEKAKVAVPVPGGVGPVTIVSLLENLVGLYQGSDPL